MSGEPEVWVWVRAHVVAIDKEAGEMLVQLRRRESVAPHRGRAWVHADDVVEAGDLVSRTDHVDAMDAERDHARELADRQC